MGECPVDLTTTGRRVRSSPACVRLTVAVLALVAVATTACSSPPAGRATDTTTTTGTSASTTVTTTPSPWSAPAPAVDTTHPITTVSCPTTTFCLALNEADTAYRYNGTTWSAALPVTAAPAPSPAAADLSCTGPTFCMAVPGGNDVVMWNGLGFAAAQDMGGAQGLQAVACASSSFCVTVDGVGDAYFYEGRWGSAVNAWGGPSSISCVDPSFCMATAGGIAQWNGHDWSQPQNVDSAGQLDTVDCTSTTFCVAADSSGNVLA